ncbi:hypothetical protein KC352_g25875, partial [Hortaea werneckii]
MVSPLDEGIFAQLREPLDPKVVEQREAELNRRLHAQYEKGQQRQAELISSNATKPITLSSIRILGATNT